MEAELESDLPSVNGIRYRLLSLVADSPASAEEPKSTQVLENVGAGSGDRTHTRTGLKGF